MKSINCYELKNMVNKFFEEVFIERMDWPPNYSVTNLIEDAWVGLRIRLAPRNIPLRTIQKLRNTLMKKLLDILIRYDTLKKLKVWKVSVLFL